MAEAVGWLEKYREFWEENYNRLDELLGILKTEEIAKNKKKVEAKKRK